MAVELYGTASCPYTAELRDDLQWRGVDFIEYDVDADPVARRRLFALLPNAPRSVPVLVENGRIVQTGWQGRGCAVMP
jgi:glutaredoxin 3